MWARALVDGNDGTQHIKAGTDCRRDSEWLRRLLVNGLAEPLDGEARSVCIDPLQIERHANAALVARAKELGMPASQIPALKPKPPET